MLKIDDRFKSWMRRRLSDRAYAERVLHAVVDEKDCSLIKVHAHAALPVKISYDPEVMIGLLKGHDNEKDEDFIVAIFGDWDDYKDLSNSYIGHLWEMYDPVSGRDFENLPHIYEIAFVESSCEEPIIKRRWTVTTEKDGVVTSESEYEDVKINLINTGLDSDVLRLILGKEPGSDKGADIGKDGQTDC